MKKHIVLILSVLFFGLWLQSCKSTSTEPTTVTLGKPTLGSTYTYVETTKDSNGYIVSRDTTNMLVADVGITYLGKTNVTKLQTGLKPEDLLYIVYETNGDFSFRGSRDDMWIILPVSGGVGYTLIDTTINGDHQVLKTSYIGTDNVTTAGKTFSVRKVKMELSSNSENSYYIFYFSDFFVRMERPIYRSESGLLSPYYDTYLVSYTIK